MTEILAAVSVAVTASLLERLVVRVASFLWATMRATDA